MTVLLAWSTSSFPAEVVGEVPGPWREVRRIHDHLLLVDSTDSLSQVYHHLKWSFEDVPVLVVAPCDDVKAKGLPPGTQTWLRARLDRSSQAATGA